MTHKLYLFHDPMCSWCWGYRPVSDQIALELPAGVRMVKVLGGLASDSDEPMAANLVESLPRAWQKIHDLLGTEFNFDFWTKCKPRRSTYPACRAVLAAGRQEKYDEMTDAIQRAYYLRAMNPSDTGTLIGLAAEIELDATMFAADLRSVEIEKELQRQIRFSAKSPIDGYPSLVLEKESVLTPVTRDYQNARTTLDHIERLVAA